MPRKSTKTTPVSAELESAPSVSVPMDAESVDVAVVCLDEVQSGESSDDVAVPVAGPKSRKSIVDRINEVIDQVEAKGSVDNIIKKLTSIRRALDGAQIKSSKKTRKPNQYNIFMSEEMEKLRDQDIPATEKFKMCIKKWNDRKAAADAQAVV
jgi:hypothetical protein